MLKKIEELLKLYKQYHSGVVLNATNHIDLISTLEIKLEDETKFYMWSEILHLAAKSGKDAEWVINLAKECGYEN